MFPIKKRYREEHMRIAEWAKKETLRPGEAGGARPETWLYNLMKYRSTSTDLAH